MDRWAVQVTGETEGLDRLRASLPPDEIVTGQNGETFVALKTWHANLDWQEVAEDGRSFVRHVNGLLRLFGGEPSQLRFGGAVRLKDGGGRDFFDEGTVVMKMTGSIVEEVIGADGVPLPPPPDPLLAVIDLARPNADIEVRHALRRLGDVDDWYEMYNVYEVVRRGLGGQPQVDGRIGAKTASRLTQTMNHYRHADAPLPADPFDFDDALDRVRGLVRMWLDDLRTGSV